MATIKKLYVFGTCILSGLAALFSIISLATEQWIYTDSAIWINQDISSTNTIEYGLFQGYCRIRYSDISLQITMTCLMKENVCALLCGKDSDERYTLLRQLYNNDPNATQNNNNCPSVQRTNSFPTGRSSVSTFNSETDKKFINAGVWLSTIIFLVLSVALGITASGLGLLNTVSNPVHALLGVFGLYIYNSVALGCTILAMCLWGIMHIVITFHDIGIFYTLTGAMSSDKRAQLGYSFWLLFIPVFFYSGSIALLYARQYLLSKDPGHKMVQREESADPGIYLY